GLLEAAAGCAAVCYGTLGQRSEPSRDVIRRFLSATPASCIRILDVNLRSPFYDESLIAESLQFANVLKLSDEELPHVVAAAELGDDADRDDEIGEPEQLRMLVEKFELRCVALTRGPRGAILCAGDQIDTRSSPACRVVDTIGAGDAFAAALVLGLLANASMDAINRTAVSVAAYACTQPGGTMSFPSIDFESDLESDFESDPLNG
ncbi:MAG: PfkB family carbohydrate kinase, partial [Planctomycetota bacterium]